MKVKGTFLFVIIAAVAMIAFFFFKKGEDKKQTLEEQEQAKLEAAEKALRTDAGRFKGQIKLGLDNFLGYYPLRSKHMQIEMLQDGFQMEIQDDGADYAERIKKIESGELDFAVFTVDSYILNAAPSFSGQIVMVISESKGADAIVVNKSISKVNDIKSITATLNSPSHQLIKASIIDFGLNELKSNIKPADGSSAALKSLLAGETDAAVLWEPDVSTALKDDRFKTLISTKSTSKLIVDILVASDDVVNNHPEKLEALLKNYFPTLRYFQKNKDILSQEFKKDAALSSVAADKIIDTIAWKSLQQNASYWFGIRSKNVKRPEFKIIETIDLTNDVLIKFGDFQKSPLPAGGAFQLLSSKQLARLHEKQSTGQTIESNDNFFERLSPREWASLDPVASLQIPPIKFKPGTRDFSEQGKIDIKNVKNILNRYPRYRLNIEGHTSNRGDAELNTELSQQRADAIRDYLVQTYKIPANRIKSTGLGPSRPIEKSPDMSYRAWLNKLPRVEFHLLEEVY